MFGSLFPLPEPNYEQIQPSFHEFYIKNQKQKTKTKRTVDLSQLPLSDATTLPRLSFA